MSGEIVGRGMLEPTQPAGEPFAVECDIRFSSTVRGDSRGFRPTVQTRCERSVVRRIGSQLIADGYYVLHIDRDGISEILQLKRENGIWHPLGDRRFSRSA